jgi:hypothetical protein
VTKLKRLKFEARRAAELHGHRLSNFIGNNRQWTATCTRCMAHAMVTLKPTPNECGVTGSAVALTCSGNATTLALASIRDQMERGR